MSKGDSFIKFLSQNGKDALENPYGFLEKWKWLTTEELAPSFEGPKYAIRGNNFSECELSSILGTDITQAKQTLENKNIMELSEAKTTVQTDSFNKLGFEAYVKKMLELCNELIEKISCKANIYAKKEYDKLDGIAGIDDKSLDNLSNELIKYLFSPGIDERVFEYFFEYLDTIVSKFDEKYFVSFINQYLFDRIIKCTLLFKPKKQKFILQEIMKYTSDGYESFEIMMYGDLEEALIAYEMYSNRYDKRCESFSEEAKNAYLKRGVPIGSLREKTSCILGMMSEMGIEISLDAINIILNDKIAAVNEFLERGGQVEFDYKHYLYIFFKALFRVGELEELLEKKRTNVK